MPTPESQRRLRLALMISGGGRTMANLAACCAAGTLNARDARRVDDALAGDPDLARQYAVIREEQREHPYMRDFMAFARQTCFSDLPGILPLASVR